jgi:hypothetical protein
VSPYYSIIVGYIVLLPVGSSVSCVHCVWLYILCSMQLLAGRLALSWARARTFLLLVTCTSLSGCSGLMIVPGRVVLMLPLEGSWSTEVRQSFY